ncbi:uncharacterized protein LOC126369793 [Pectinophora gossypiella]|uniref:uncharacterized protein LOC126369793 n=1 Tax=Pectinophora gossypiella TaxID=13191 RepID=UPI00214F4598|nr:uncharacterized protein LOC126369793 [Pectinophora gossypiella]
MTRLYRTKITPDLTRIIKELKDQQVLEKPAQITPSFLSKMFIAPKSNGGLRPIFDLRGLNRFVHSKHFQLIPHASVPEFLQKEDWMVKIDMSNAYFHVPIAEAHRCYLRLVYNGELLQMSSLPFGLASAPRTFAALTNWIAEILRSRGIRVLVYLDDFLLVNQDQTKLISQTSEVGRLHCRYLQIFLKRFKSNQNLLLVLPPQVRNDMKWWSKSIQNKSDLHQSPYTHFLTTDASDSGWGAQLNETLLSESWTKEQRRKHSNWKELFAVYASIRDQFHRLQNAHILVQSDNRTLVSYIRKEGGTHSLDLLNLTCKLLKLTDRLNITLSAHYLPGRYNCTADRLSRARQISEWHLLPTATNRLFHRWGTPDVDLFASAETAVVNRYVSLDCKDHSALFSNAFSQEWEFQLGWIFPPPNLIPRVLAHLNSAKGLYIVITPLWEKTFWLADLRSRALEPPITIERLSECLVDTATKRPPVQVDQLNLQAWLIGGGGNKLVTGQNPKSNCYVPVGGNPQ